jgi:hypothetical protein
MVGYEDVGYILETYPSVSASVARTTEIRTIRVHGLTREQVIDLVYRITADRSRWNPPSKELDSEYVQIYLRDSNPYLIDTLRPQIVAYPTLDGSDFEIVEVRQLSQAEIWFRKLVYIGRNPFPHANEIE